MKPSGAHTHPEMAGGGGGKSWLVVIGAIALTVLAGPAAHAIRDLVMVVAITMTVVLAVAGTAAVVIYRVRCRDARALTRGGIRVLPTPEQRALGPAQQVHLHFYGVSPGDVAAIIARQDEAGD
jgi:hypothetical protein